MKMKGKLYTYNNSGDDYFVMEDNAKMKISHLQGAPWVRAVIYQNNTGEIFVREYNDFVQKFNIADSEEV